MLLMRIVKAFLQFPCSNDIIVIISPQGAASPARHPGNLKVNPWNLYTWNREKNAC